MPLLKIISVIRLPPGSQLEKELKNQVLEIEEGKQRREIVEMVELWDG